MKKAAEAARQALGAKPKAPRGKAKHRPTRTVIDHAVNGGHVVRHEFARGGDTLTSADQPEAGPYALANTQELHDHLDQQLGGDDGAEAQAGAPAAQ